MHEADDDVLAGSMVYRLYSLTCLIMMVLQNDDSNYVHKQGFLVKQGGRVKSWKKRLFVLDSEGLSYYKTETVCITIKLRRYVLL